MRLTQRDLKEVYLFTPETVESGYVGTITKWTYTETVKCDVQPADNKIEAEVYGERVYNMLSILCLPDCGMSEDIRLSINSKAAPEYKVVSIKPYSDHLVVLAEKLALEPFVPPESSTEPEQDYGFYPR